MCGIAAIIGPAANPDILRRMVAQLHHRGPDDQQTALLPGCALGHTRLSIIDLAGGKQPMCDPSGRYWIIFNGEIYNYQWLRQRLQQEGVELKTSSDTEALLHSCITWGKDAPAKCHGQFAFLFWDAREQRGFAARDRLGEKPFYYTRQRDCLFIASEIKALLAVTSYKISRQHVDAMFALDYVPGSRSIFEGVHQLSPGWIMNLTRERFTLEEYWRPEYETRKDVPEQEAVREIRKLITEAVEQQMVADVPLGAFLSGGLDSSTIVALASQISSTSLQTFSVGFGAEINELPHAAAVAKRYNTDHHELQVSLNIAESIQTMARIYDEPIADSANIPTYLLSKFTREHVKVALAGEGGDELFCGYWWHEHLGRLGWRAESPLSSLVNKIQRHLSSDPNRVARSTARVLGRAEYSANENIWERTLALHVRAPEQWCDRVTENALRTISDSFSPGVPVNNINAVSEFDLRVYLPDNILTKVDRASMAASLEVRSPLLHPPLVEYVLSLPWHLRYIPGEPKRLLKLACADLLPPELLTRKKQGFGAPVAAWTALPEVRSLAERYCKAGSPLDHLYPGIAEAYTGFEPQQKWRAITLGAWLHERTVNFTE